MTWLLALTPALAAELPDPLDGVVEQAAASELPIEPLEQKALEGLAKGVPPERIESVMRELLGRWYGAEQLLGERAQASDRREIVPAAAAAIEQGALADSIVSLSSEPAAVHALWTLSDVLYAGMAPADAERLVRSALATRDPEMALRELPEATRLLVEVAGAASATEVLTSAMSSGQMPLAALAAAPSGTGDGRGRGNGNGNGGQGWGKGGKPK